MEIVDIGKLWSQTPPSEPIGSRNWCAFARCAGEDTEQFYEGINANARTPHAQNLIDRFCTNCPVIEYCLDEAIKINDENGIWGGTIGRERRALRRAIIHTVVSTLL